MRGKNDITRRGVLKGIGMLSVPVMLAGCHEYSDVTRDTETPTPTETPKPERESRCLDGCEYIDEITVDGSFRHGYTVVVVFTERVYGKLDVNYHMLNGINTETYFVNGEIGKKVHYDRAPNNITVEFERH